MNDEILGPDERDEEDFYDEEYEDYFDDTDEKPIAVDEFFELPFDHPRRREIWEELHEDDP